MSPYVLTWLEARQCYDLSFYEQHQQLFQRGEEQAWSRWLDEHTAFAFVSPAGRISILKETGESLCCAT